VGAGTSGKAYEILQEAFEGKPKLVAIDGGRG